ncbi:MAG TPA: ABC transporter permease [Alphaproteobacteria bacterium]|nr:ABC transporter permease [Alphaproteobacteria bacterium]
MRLRLELRERPSRAIALCSPLAAVALTLACGAALFTAIGYDPRAVLDAYFLKPLGSVYGLAELALKATPLALCATGLAVGFRGNVWNIGAEGQLTMGAIAGGGLALAFPDSESGWLLPAMLVAGILGGMAWAAIPAFLRTRFQANEILTSLMLTYVAQLFLGYLVHGPWRDPAGFNFPQSRQFGDAALLPVLVGGTRLTPAIFFALAAVALVWLLLARSFAGFRIRVVGLAAAAADYAGFSHGRVIWLSLLLSGGLAGLAGICEVAGPIGQLLPVISPGYGFAAIIVAFLGRLHPVGILLASLLMALVYLGGESAQVDLGLPLAVTGMFQGLLLFFLLAGDLFLRYRLRVAVPASAAA